MTKLHGQLVGVDLSIDVVVRLQASVACVTDQSVEHPLQQAFQINE